MSHDELLAYAAMVKRLDEWAQTVASRDELIREAKAANMSNAQIARHMGISRQTVITVLGTDDESSEEG
jgi:predicted DNA-binding protein (UPF0251 family)